MSASTYDTNGVLRQFWDDTARTYTEYDATGAQSLTRPYTAAENATADAWAAQGTQNANLATLQQRAQNALQNNTTYLGIASPNNAQVVAQVGRLTRQVNALIRMDLRLLDTISDS